MLNDIQFQNLSPEQRTALGALTVLITLFDRQLKSGQHEIVITTCSTSLEKSDNKGLVNYIFFHYRSLGYEYAKEFSKSYSDAKKAFESLKRISGQNSNANFGAIEKVISDRVVLLRAKSKKWWQFWK